MLIKNTRKKEDFTNKFYIVNRSTKDKSWFQLRLVENHSVISAVNTLDDCLRCLNTICERYGNYTNLIRKLNKGQHYPYPNSAEEKQKRVEEYKLYKDEYKEYINNIITKYNDRILESNTHTTRKKILVNKNTDTHTSEVTPPKNISHSTKKVKPTIKIKPKKKPRIKLSLS